MINISTEFNEYVQGFDRNISVRLVLNDNLELDGEYIKDISFTERATEATYLSMGECCAKQVIVNMYKPSKEQFFLNGSYLDIYVGVSEWEVPLGRFYVDTVTTNELTAVNADAITYTITAYDAIYKMSAKKYVPTISFPASANDIVRELAQSNGLTVTESIESDIVIDTAYDCYEKNMLCYIAGLMGKNVRINRYNQIEFYWYTDYGYVVDEDQQYMSGLVRSSSENFSINSITSGTSDNIIVSGNGVGIEFENPYMSQEKLDGIFADVGYSTYTPATLKYRCNPAVEIGDILTVIDTRGVEYQIYVTAQTLSISGGLVADITSIGGSESVSLTTKTPTEIKLEQLSNSLTESFKENFKAITGATDGYFSIDLDSNGIAIGWSIKDTPTITPTTHIWKMTMGGFAFSSDGGASYSNFALDLNGHVSASAITTGTMSAQRIGVEGGTLDDYFKVGKDDSGQIYVQIGSSKSSIKLKEVNDRIGFYDNEDNLLAFFSNNAFDIVDLQRFKIGNFAFIPRTNGNLSFMKVV